ncbi:MAG: hypothetical protein AAF572_24280 [Cyanobacteria bacterium P01_B01_bin.77]
MQYQLIQNFLSLPGIIGFSLMSLDQDTPSGQRVHSLGFPHGQGLDQRPMLVQGIQHIIGTTPTSLEFCAFQFSSYQVELYKAERAAILLVVSEGQLSNQYAKAVSELMQFIKADYPALVESIEAIKANDQARDVAIPKASLTTAHLDDVVAAMNSLSQVTSRYLGPQIVANHWRTYQLEDIAWLEKFDIAANGTISVVDTNPELSPVQLAEIRLWTKRFHQRCTRIIRDYDTLVEQTLPVQHWQLLFGS